MPEFTVSGARLDDKIPSAQVREGGAADRRAASTLDVPGLPGAGTWPRNVPADELLHERERALQALRRSEARFRAAYRNAAVGMVITDGRGQPVEVNQMACAMLGYPEDELRGLTFQQITHPDDVADSVARRARLLDGSGRAEVFEKRCLRKDGSVLWAQVSLSLVADGADDGPPHVLALIEDISSRRQTTEALRASEERFRLVAHATRDVLWDWNVQTAEHWWSPNATALFGHDPSAERDISAWTSRLHADDRLRVLSSLDTALRSRDTSWDGSYRLRLADGSYGDFVDRGHILRDAQGQALRMIGAMTDVTEVNRAHRSLVETHDHLRALVRDVHLAESRERAALARELHDEFGQLLTAAKLNASWLKAHAPATPTLAADAYREKAANLCDVIDMALHGVRHVASQLRPPALDQLGLPRALQGLAAQIERHAGFDCQVTTDDATRAAVFGPAQGAALYRMAQELLTNAARHAGATQVRVSLATIGDRVTLTVEDDGRGFSPPDAATSNAWGLKGIRERAELLGGSVNVHSRPGAGTTVRVVLPRGAGA